MPSSSKALLNRSILRILTLVRVLLEKNPNAMMAPASMTKMMTVYLLLERLKGGNLSLEDTFRVSEKAWGKGGSKMYVDVGFSSED